MGYRFAVVASLILSVLGSDIAEAGRRRRFSSFDVFDNRHDFFENPYFNYGNRNSDHFEDFNNLFNNRYTGTNNLYFNPFNQVSGQPSYPAFQAYGGDTDYGRFPTYIGASGGGTTMINTGGFGSANLFDPHYRRWGRFDPWYDRSGFYPWDQGRFHNGRHGFSRHFNDFDFGGGHCGSSRRFRRGCGSDFGFGGQGWNNRFADGNGRSGNSWNNGGNWGSGQHGNGGGYGSGGGYANGNGGGGNYANRPYDSGAGQWMNESYKKWKDGFANNATALSLEDVNSLQGRWANYEGAGYRAYQQRCATGADAQTYDYTVFLFSNGNKSWLSYRQGFVEANEKWLAEAKATWKPAQTSETGTLTSTFNNGSQMWVKKVANSQNGLDLQSKISYGGKEYYCKTINNLNTGASPDSYNAAVGTGAY